MRSVIASVSSLLLGVLILLMANGLLSTLLAVRLGMDEVSPTLAGLVLAAYHVGFFTGALRAQSVLRRVGHIRAFAVFAALMTVAALLHGLVSSLWLWAALRLVAGFSMAALFLVTESWLNERADTGNRGMVLSLYMIVSQFGLGLGQLLLGSAPAGAHDLFMISGILFALALIPTGLTRSMAPAPPPEQHVALRRLWEISPIGMVGATVAGFILGAFFAMGPLVVTALGLGSGLTGSFMAAVVFGGMLLQWPLGALSDRVGRQGVMAGVSALLASMSVAMILAPAYGPAALLLTGAAFGGFLFMLYPLAVAQANDWARADERVGVAGALLITYGLGAMTGPALGGAALDLGGPAAFFGMIAVILGLQLAFLFAQLARRPQLPALLQVRWLPMMRTSTAMADLDPRMEEAASAAVEERGSGRVEEA